MIEVIKLGFVILLIVMSYIFGYGKGNENGWRDSMEKVNERDPNGSWVREK